MRIVAIALCLLAALAGYGESAFAIPAFNRQTGQNCVACHAGGQFPELTPYGRLFKLTGYTIGQRALPLSVMGVASYNKTRSTSSSDPNVDRSATFPKDGSVVFQTASAFFGGKVTDNLGGFVQYTYNNYDHQDSGESHWIGHAASDNLDVRYADRFIAPGHDLIVGLTLNNNPSVQDPWNSAPAWGFNVVPGSSGPATAPLVAGGLAQNVAGLGAYLYWNRALYAEVATYRTANGFWSFMSHGFNAQRGDQQVVKGANPYWRVALTREWGAHNAMVGASGFDAKVYPDPTDPAGPTNHFRDIGIDGQYQYILDPHAITLTGSYTHERVTYASTLAGQPPPLDPDGSIGLPLTADADTLRVLRLKGSYVYRARYGGTLQYFDVDGSSDPALQTSAFDPANPGELLDGSQGVTGNLASNPGTRGVTAEAFWLPVQNVRVGIQYTAFSRFNGASGNYDGFGRRPRDNDTVFLYFWGAF